MPGVGSVVSTIPRFGARKRGNSADDQLTEWGFRSVDRLTSGDTGYLIWYNRSLGQCLQETMADGRIVSIDAIGSHPTCH